MKFGKNGGQTMAAGVDDKDGIAEVLQRREKRGREEREEERKKPRRFKSGHRLARLSRTICSSVTEGHMAHDG
jgi:hypothetical protein